MHKRILLLSVFYLLWLTACVSSQATPTERVAPQAVPAATITEPPASAQHSDCTLVSTLPEATQDGIDLFSVLENDWVVGPEDFGECIRFGRTGQVVFCILT